MGMGNWKCLSEQIGGFACRKHQDSERILISSRDWLYWKLIRELKTYISYSQVCRRQSISPKGANKVPTLTDMDKKYCPLSFILFVFFVIILLLNVSLLSITLCMMIRYSVIYVVVLRHQPRGPSNQGAEIVLYQVQRYVLIQFILIFLKHTSPQSIHYMPKAEMLTSTILLYLVR